MTMKLIIATRLHLGHSLSPPSNERLTDIIQNMERLRLRAMSSSSNTKSIVESSLSTDNYHNNSNKNAITHVDVVIAVDATPKIEGYDYVQAVRDTVDTVQSTNSKHQVNCHDNSNSTNGNSHNDNDTSIAATNNDNHHIHVLPVTPWGKFVPALNAIILHAREVLSADIIMFVSAEIDASAQTISTLCRCVIDDPNVVAAGAVLPGHDYQGQTMQQQQQQKEDNSVVDSTDHSNQSTPVNPPVEVPLTGRTTPWNTLCVWDLRRLSLVGFACVSDLGTTAGVEECAAIAIIQKIYPQSKACLLLMDDIRWEKSFGDDIERKKWHEQKMKSKVERPEWQLQQLNNLTGTVLHF